MVETRPDAVFDERTRRARDIGRVARRDGPVGEDRHFLASFDPGDDPVDAALLDRPGCNLAEEALHSENPDGARRLGAGARDLTQRQPLAEQLGQPVEAPRMRLVLLRIRSRGLAIEDEIGAVVHDRARDALGRAYERQHTERVHGQRRRRVALRAVDVVVGGAIDDEVGAEILDRPMDGAGIRDVELGVAERVNLRGMGTVRELARDRGPEKAAGAGDEHTRHWRSASASVRTTASCCSSVSSP